ncbi:MAG TPA: hypothetical protein VEP90_23010 [Methylomirabilota bacterium]|nr:hypothetical protein [Methylomirabilota bacterium]
MWCPRNPNRPYARHIDGDDGRIDGIKNASNLRNTGNSTAIAQGTTGPTIRNTCGTVGSDLESRMDAC